MSASGDGSDAVLRVAIVGGGIAGLSVAHALATRDDAPPIDVTLYEATGRLGGNIRTDRRGGFTIDAGPDSWIATKPDAATLARAVRLGPELMGTQETNRHVYLAWDRDLHRMPEGLVLGIPTEIRPIAETPLFSIDAKLRMALEPLIPKRTYQGDEDESVGDFVTRRLGAEVTERLVGPLLGGIFAGDPYAISVRAAFPQLVAAEQQHGSLIRAMREQRRAREAERDGGPRPSAFQSLQGGLGTLVDAVAEAIAGRVTVVTGACVRTVARADDGAAGYAVETDDGDVAHVDAVALCGPLHASARVVRDLDGELASALDGLMGYTSTATVFLAMRRADVHHTLDGTGFIVPRSLGRPLLAVTWASSKWEHRAPGGHTLIRAFFGGAGREDVVERDDRDLVDLAMREVSAFTPLGARPLFANVYRFVRASPQPYVGHLGRVRRLKALASRHHGLHFAASALDGVGIPDAVRQGKAIADAIVARANACAAVATSSRSSSSPTSPSSSNPRPPAVAP